MKADVLMDLIAKLDELPGAGDTKAQLREMILEVGVMHGVAACEQEQRIRFARHLLDIREPRPLIRDRIKVRFALSTAQAYRVIDAALNIVSKSDDA